MGRRPIGDKAMSAAERQRKRRKHIVTEPPVTKPDVTKPEPDVTKQELIEARAEIERLLAEVKRLQDAVSELEWKRDSLRELWWIGSDYRLIASCLHPDARISISEEKLSEAFRTFDGLIKPLVMTKAEEAKYRRRVEADLQYRTQMREAFAQRQRKKAEDAVREAERREARSAAAKAKWAAKKQAQTDKT